MECSADLEQSGHESKSNDRMLHSPQISNCGASPSDAVSCHTQDTFFFLEDILLI